MTTATTEAEAKPPLQVDTSRGFTAWLASQRVSLAVTTYQAGKLFLFGTKANGSLHVHERTLERCMGLCVQGQQLYVASLYQIWRFNNVVPPGGRSPNGDDALYLPQASWVTGDVDAHDMAYTTDGRLLFANTLFSCLAQVTPEASFVPVWQPPFITRLAAEDRCHLNGLALRDGQPAFMTAVSTTDLHEGWREHRVAGGVVLSVPEGEVVCSGLSMPHSPRWHEGALWVLNSGCGELGRVNLSTKQFEPLAFLPGYARGMALVGDYAVVGLSKPRGVKTFQGLPLQDKLTAHQASARCGLVVVKLSTGDIVHSLTFDGVVEELYDVALLPGVKQPAAVGFKGNDIRHTLNLGASV